MLNYLRSSLRYRKNLNYVKRYYPLYFLNDKTAEDQVRELRNLLSNIDHESLENIYEMLKQRQH